MAVVRVRPGAQHYAIEIAPGSLTLLAGWLERHAPGVPVAIISDSIVAGLYLEPLVSTLASPPAVRFVFPAGEASKTLSTAAAAFEALAGQCFERSGIVVALGGGVVTDLAGFVAGVWMRGVRFVSLPTTVEAALDAAVGGKAAVNLPAGKNLVGVFHQPAAVFIDPRVFGTLPPREVRAGLAESVKHGILRDPALLEWQALHAADILALDEQTWVSLIARNCRIKADIVERDEREAGLRAILNYGHTIGHALEHVFEYEWRHGECVALGMLAENEIAVRRGWLDRSVADEVRTRLAQLGLPVCLDRPCDAGAIYAATRIDKKSRAGAPEYVLIRDLGVPVRASDVTESEVAAALAVITPG